MKFFRSPKSSRLFILGLDGSPLPLLQRLMQAGDLPNLARVFETGSAIEMNSSLPDVSAVAWTSINTGMNPAKHGIYGFVNRKPGSETIDVMTSAHTKAKTIWELVSDAGRRAVAVNVPLSYPPQRINGVVISDFLAPALAKAVYPTTLLQPLQSMGYRIDTDPWAARQSLDAFVEDFRITAGKRAEAVLYLMEQQSWDLFMVVFMETDRLHHFMWQYMEDDDPTYGKKFMDAYRQIDTLAGKIIGKLTDDDALIILSDHGFTTLKHEVYLNHWLEREGYLCFQEGVDRGQLSLAPLAPTTRAYSLDPGRVYVNLMGREPHGTVSTSEYPALVSELRERLEVLRDPASDVPMVEHAYLAGDIYHGPHRDQAPDILVMPMDGYDMKGAFDYTALTGRGKLVGMHKYDNATLFVRSHGMQVEHASIHDVLPTACELMGLPCPPNVDGSSVIRG